MSVVGGVDTDIVQRWILDPSQYKKEIGEVAKLIQQQHRHERDLTAVRAELERQTGTLTEATRKQAEAVTAANTSSTGWIANMTKSVTAGNLWSAAVQKGIGVVRESISTLDTYSKTADVFRGNLDKLKAATGGTVSALDLMQAQNRMVTLGIKLTEEQMASLLESTKKLAPAMGLDMKSALDSVATAMARQSEKIADNIGVVIKAEDANKKYAAQIGVNVKQLTDEQSKLAFVNDMLAQMKTKADGTADATATLTTNLGKLGIFLKDNLLALMASLNRRLGDTKLMADSLGTGPWNAWVRSQDKDATRKAYMGKSAKDMAAEEQAQRDYETAHYGSYFTTSTPGLGKSAAVGTGGGTYGVGSWRKEAQGRYTAGIGTHKAKKTGGAGYDGAGIFGVRGWVREMEEAFDQQAWAISQQMQEEIDRAVLAHTMQRIRRIQDADEKWERSKVDQSQGNMFARAERAGAEASRSHLEDYRQKRREGEVGELQGTFAGSLLGDKSAQAAMKSAEALAEYRKQVQGLNADMESFTVGSLANFTGGIWAAADAAIQGGESFGVAMAKMLKGTLLSIAQQATVKAIFNLAEAAAQWFNPVAVSSHLAAAALYGSVAVVSGGLGLGLSAAMAPGKSSGASHGAPANAGSGSYKPSYGSRESGKEKPIIVNLWMGNKGDPAAHIYMRQQVKAMAA